MKLPSTVRAVAAQAAAEEQQRAAQVVELRQGVNWTQAELSNLAMTAGFGSRTVTVAGGKSNA